MADSLRITLIRSIAAIFVFSSNLAHADKESCKEIIDSSAFSKLCGSCGSLRDENASSKDVCLVSKFRPISQTVQQPFSRCCVLSNCKLGVDLRNCSVSMSIFHEAEAKIPINHVMVDVGHACPGGDVLWGEISLMNHAKICSKKFDLCANVTCPSNSHCTSNVTETQCVCNKGFYGYRCLRNGKFPAIQWLCSMAGATLVLTFGLRFFQHLSMRKLKSTMMDSLSTSVTQGGPVQHG